MSYPDFIEELIIEKEYSALTQEEKQLIGEWIANEEEYTEIRSLLIELESAVQNQEQEEAPQALRGKLNKVYAEKHKAKKRLLVKWQAVAAITVAASFALILYVGFLFMDNNKAPQLAEKKENKKTETVTPKKEVPISNEDKQPQEPISSNEVKEQKALSEREIEKPLPPPPPILEIVEDDEEVEDAKPLVDVEVNKSTEFYYSSPEVETFTIEKKLEPRDLAEITAISPSTATTIVVESDKDKKYINTTPSVAENLDLLELNVPVF